MSKNQKRKWYHTLKFKLTILHFTLLLFLITCTSLVLFYAQKEFLHKESLRNNKTLGQSIVAELSQRLTKTEALVKSLARISESLDPDEEFFKNKLSSIINFNGEQSIAGGGIWPEPYKFHKDTERRSFFWGRDSTGELKYYDDYNDPAGAGYHHEEWYVPARFLREDQVYWSQSYIDVYSGEPMVTCTAPMYRKGKFYGVTTIDLKLTGLDSLLATQAKNVNGYIFALDRNNKLLSYPNHQMAKAKAHKQAKFAEFHHLKKLATKFPSYAIIHEEISEFNRNLKSDEFSTIEKAKNIDLQSHQINQEQARLIAITSDQKLELWVSQKSAINDPILQTDCLYTTVFMPRTSWKVVIVSPLSSIEYFSNKVTYTLLMIMISVELAILLIMFFVANRTVINPIFGMSKILSQANAKDHVELDESSKDEVGLLAHEFNERSRIIARNLKEIEEKNNKLEHAKKVAESANESKSTFLANMSHEIRTPLTAIIGYANYIIENKESEKERETNLEIIKKNGEHLLDIINDILDLSKIEADKLHIAHQDCQLRDIIDDCRRITQIQNGKKKIEFKLNPIYPLPESFKTDQTKLRQIILNLISNAEKFTEEGFIELKITYKKESNQVLFQVIDTGIGMTQEQQQKVFEAFEQADSNITRRYGGTGLGMKISYQLAKLLGGKLSVESEFGIGSTFSLTLDLKERPQILNEAPSETKKIVKKELKTDSFEGHLLLVEDNKTNQKLISKILTKKGLTVEIANDGYEGLKQVQNKDYDLVLMDLQMPNMDGITATQKIRTFNEEVPIVAITANAFESDRQNCMDAGFNDFLTKPLKQDHLWTALAKYL